ncbi:MAG: DeoR/GlpR transcriptional regulator [Spirochaetales bacterium]|nr:DeoR/GlpR transcriptional regulator [Spirochaetales bacterium]
MKKSKRLKYILKLLKINNISNVQELSQKLEVSHMTVRRDLEELAEQNKVRILHGSIILHPVMNSHSTEKPYSIITEESVHIEEKRRIGIMAASCVEPGDTIIIDYGSTAEYFAKNIPTDIPLTILSYSLNIVSDIAYKENCTLIFTGGLFHKNTLSFESPEGLEMIKNFRANKAFVTASGIDYKFGATCSNFYERPTKKALMQSSMKKILLVDSSKFGLIRSDYFADLNEFDEIITDKGIPDEYRKIIHSLGIILRIA